jgi:hypothetical protein
VQYQKLGTKVEKREDWIKSVKEAKDHIEPTRKKKKIIGYLKQSSGRKVSSCIVFIAVYEV